MAKAQKRGNREAKKPKAAKPAPSVEPQGLLSRGSTIPAGPPKKKR
ncbi:MAG: hypothetical protein PHS60_18215 [Zavarzinia sp.]|nr:hypothetical protein [Zavarzinia sp.]